MKKILLIGAIISTSAIFAQEEKDTTTIDFGDTKVVIIEKEDSDKDWDKDKKDKTFNAWTGVDLGFNMLATSDGDINLPKEYNYLETDYARSLAWSFNFADVNWDWFEPKEGEQYRTNNIGIISGIGLTFRNYALNNNYLLTNVDDSTFGVNIMDTASGLAGLSRDYSKNKFRTVYLRVPVMLQFYTMKEKKNKLKHRFHMAAGVVGGLRLGSSTKVKYKQDGESFKDKQEDDFNLSPFTLDAELRVGFGALNLYASYGLTPLFRDGRGPEVYPISVGISLTKAFD